MSALWAKVKSVLAGVLPFLKAALSKAVPALAWVLGWLKTIVVTVLMPAWKPVVVLARNPLTGIMMVLCMIAAFAVGDLTRALKNHNDLANQKTLFDKKLEAVRAKDLADQAALVKHYQDELAALQKQSDSKSSVVRLPAEHKAAPTVVKAAPAKPFWQF